MRPLPEHAKRLLGREISDVTSCRWAKMGLECYFIGGIWVTSTAAMVAWIERQTAARRESNRRSVLERQARAALTNRARAEKAGAE